MAHPGSERRSHKGAANQAKMLDETQVRQIAFDLLHKETGSRDIVAFYLSFYCGLRAQEIALLEWDRHVFDSKGDIGRFIQITGDIGKKGVARKLDIPTPLRTALTVLREARPRDRFVFHPKDGRNDFRPYDKQEGVKPNTVVKFFERLYARYNLDGCSSHSGRRSAITKFSRLAAKTGEHSFRDVMNFAGHKNPGTTMTYIEPNEERGAIIEDLWGADEMAAIRNEQRRAARRAARQPETVCP